MYGRFFGLREPPFELRPDPRFLLMTQAHREALATLQYGLSKPHGLVVLLGEAGTGKTTLLRAAVASIDVRQRIVCRIDNPALSRAELSEFLAAGLGLDPAAARSKSAFLQGLRELLGRPGAAGAVIVDDVQAAPAEVLEELRLLANVEGSGGGSLSMVLSGLPAFAERLNDPLLQQLKQRTTLRCVLRPLSMDETAAYVSSRLRIAGGSTHIFSSDALASVYRYSGGIPRVINVLCDNALVSAYASAEHVVGGGTVVEAARELDLSEQAWDAPAPSAQLEVR
jgi:general secretion pathway protein A